MTPDAELLRSIRAEFLEGRYRFTLHAIQEATRDRTAVEDVVCAILDENAVIIEEILKTLGVRVVSYWVGPSRAAHCIWSSPTHRIQRSSQRTGRTRTNGSTIEPGEKNEMRAV